MKQNYEFDNWFDDDFEVTYEEYNPNEYHRGNDYYRSQNNRHNKYHENSCDDNDYDDYEEDKESRKKERRKKRSQVPLAAPIRKGGRVLSSISSSLIRSLTVILIVATMSYASWTFLRASAPYGDLMESLNTQTISISLASYLSVALIFLFFELIALLWSMTKVRIRDQWGVYKEDIGRGLCSFVFVFLTSYASFWLHRFVPESPEILYGLKGALEVYGSMHNALFGLCTIGVISCLLRKFFK